jgi:non-ribosomal peptide synthetase component F
MERSIDSVVAILGILKSGAAFVPLDVDWPDARLAFVIENAAITRVLSRAIYLERHSPLSCDSIFLEAVNSASNQLDDTSVVQPADWRSLAYVLYTSGSTGRPKGVRIEHRSVVNYVLSATKRMDLGDMTSYALVQPLSADSSGTSLYCALLSGAALHILSTEEALDGNWLADYMDRFDIDVLKILPSHFEALQAPDRITVAPRKRLILGGEMPRPRLVTDVLEAFPELRVFNHYGPTEATIAVAACELDQANVDDGNRYLPVGRPFGNCRIHILDDDMQTIAAGVSGEVYLGGDPDRQSSPS